MLIRKKVALLIGVSVILLASGGFVGSVSAQESGLGADTVFNDTKEINTVYADSGRVRIGDVQWTDDSLRLTIENQGGRTTVTAIDQARIVGSSGFQRIPRQSVSLGVNETVVMDIPAHNSGEYGQIITISDGTNVITLTNNSPGFINVSTFGVWTWLIGLGFGFVMVFVAALWLMKGKLGKIVQVI